MFRTVHAFIEKPTFWLICDDRTCNQIAAGELLPETVFPPTTPQEAAAFAQTQAHFFAAAQQLGWLIGLDGQFCPGHSKAMRESAAMTRQMIQVADRLPVLGGNGRKN